MYGRSEFGNNSQIKHQRLAERDALVTFQSLFPENLKECGLFIDKDLSYLCASPFRLYGTKSILNIKCPVKEFNKPFEKAMPKIKFFKKNGSEYVINEKSEWYIELQGEMHVTQRKFAYLVIWLGESNYRIMEVARNETFFKEKILPKLVFFYEECMLKELVDARVGRNMKLRAYDAQTLSFI